MGHAQSILHLNQRLALRRWLESTQEFKSQREFVLHCQRVMLDFSRRTALRRLAHLALCSRKLHRHNHFATTRAQHRCQAVALLAWARWSYRRLQRRRLYMGHVATRVLPRLLRATFELWVSTFRRLQRHNAALQRARIVMALSLKGRSFHSWHGVIQSKRKGRTSCVVSLKLLQQCILDVGVRRCIVGRRTAPWNSMQSITTVVLLIVCFSIFSASALQLTGWRSRKSQGPSLSRPDVSKSKAFSCGEWVWRLRNRSSASQVRRRATMACASPRKPFQHGAEM